ADFSFLRARGLRGLLGFLRATAAAPDDSRLLLFRHSQSIPDLQGNFFQPATVDLHAHFGDVIHPARQHAGYWISWFLLAA
uniref:Uncharacterized protein n=1 Tax=Aegilops tauschii subsp. strangulata TaxID=200361 RepID=A0A453QI10_AEGTS